LLFSGDANSMSPLPKALKYFLIPIIFFVHQKSDDWFLIWLSTFTAS